MARSSLWMMTFAAAGAAGLSAWTPAQVAPRPVVKAFVGATILGAGVSPPVRDGVLLVSNGRIERVGPRGSVTIPDGASVVETGGKFLMPGFVNAHGHVGDTRGLESGPRFYTDENVLGQLQLYARYGVTTVMSLGGDGPAGFKARDTQSAAGLARARIFVAGPVITAENEQAARTAVNAAADLKPDFIKFRMDDNLGTTPKMKPEVGKAIIEEAHRRGLRVAVHIFYLDDAKALLRDGADFLAHSVRDRDVDADLIALMKARNICLSPTLMREVSTFVYETRPAFFDDPFFRRDADEAVLRALESPERQGQMRTSRSAQAYKQALVVASRNAKALSQAGIRLASGTDTGPPARFQGYFEHLELERLVEAGLTPAQALEAATADAAGCLGLGDQVGSLERGRYADFLVLGANPLEDIRHTRRLESVWIGGEHIP